MIESGLLDELVAPFDGEPEDWADVLGRVRRQRPRRRIALAVAVPLVAAAAAAVALPLLRSDAPKLPAAADHRDVQLVLQPRTGRVLIEAAAWKGHSGVCYVVLDHGSGCTARAARRAMVAYSKGHVPPSDAKTYAVWSITFDAHVASAKVAVGEGKPQPAPIHRVGGNVRATFVGPVRIRVGIKGPVRVLLFDAAGRLIRQHG